MLDSSLPLSRRMRRAGALATFTTLAGLTLVGCSPSDEPTETAGPGASVSPTAGPGATSEPTPSATPTPTPPPPTSVPVTLDCATLVPSQALYDFNPNVGAQPDYSPAEGTLPAELVEQDGVACGFVNQTSGEQFEFAVAHLVPAEAQQRKDALVVANDPVPIYAGDEGYFTVENDIGQAQVFAGEYWVVGRSSAFYEPGDHAALVNSVVENVIALQP